MKKRIALLLCLTMLICLLGGCSSPAGKPITCKDLTLKLPGEFYDFSGESYAKEADFFYGRDKLIVMGMAEEKTILKKMTLEEYTELVIQGNKLQCVPRRLSNGYCFTYETPTSDGTYYIYTVATFESGTRFWILQLYCPSDDYPERQKMIVEILESVRVTGMAG